MVPASTTAGPNEPCTCYRDHAAIARDALWSELPLLAVERDGTSQTETRQCAGGGLIVARKPVSAAAPWRFLSGRKSDFAPDAVVVAVTTNPSSAQGHAHYLSHKAAREAYDGWLYGSPVHPGACRDVAEGLWVVVDTQPDRKAA